MGILSIRWFPFFLLKAYRTSVVVGEPRGRAEWAAGTEYCAAYLGKQRLEVIDGLEQEGKHNIIGTRENRLVLSRDGIGGN
jgi:hypothetical protein